MVDEAKPGIKPAPIWMRLASLLLGGAILLWLPLEDRGSQYAIITGIAAAGLVGIRLFRRVRGARSSLLRYAIITGLVGGVLVSVFSAGLMVIKNGIHGHGVPDYSLAQVLDVLYMTPIWMVGGVLVGLGGGLLVLSRGEF